MKNGTPVKITLRPPKNGVNLKIKAIYVSTKISKSNEVWNNFLVPGHIDLSSYVVPKFVYCEYIKENGQKYTHIAIKNRGYI